MSYFVGIIFIAFGIHTLSSDISSFRGWISSAVGILSLAYAINKPKNAESKDKGDGYRSSSADYTNGGGSGGGE